MNIGVPRERRADEHRVGLTPAAVERLVAAGHTCSVEKNAGLGAGYADLEYERAGARIVNSGEEAYGRSDLVLKVSKPTEEEVHWLSDGSILMGFLHLAAGHRDRIDALLAKRVTAVAYETIQTDDGALPVLAALSRLAGMMVPQVAGTLLQNDRGGKGILLSGLPGLVDMRGWADLFDFRLQITQVGIADELAAAASLVMGQAAEGTPVVHVRGFPYLLREGSMAELIRPRDQDLFR
jgi:alanine dehydrogenase